MQETSEYAPTSTSISAPSGWSQDLSTRVGDALKAQGYSRWLTRNVIESIRESWDGFHSSVTQDSACTYETMSDSLVEEIARSGGPKLNPVKALLLHHSQLSNRCPKDTLRFVIGLIQCLRGDHPEAPWHWHASMTDATIAQGKNKFDRILCSTLAKLSIEPDDEECAKLRISSTDMLYSAHNFMKDTLRTADFARIAYAIEAVLKQRWRDPLEYFSQDDGPLHFMYYKDRDDID